MGVILLCISFFIGWRDFCPPILALFLLRGPRAGKPPFPAILTTSLVKTAQPTLKKQQLHQ
jgi:hypothetical protein